MYLGRLGQMALSMAATHPDSTYEETVEVLAIHFGPHHVENSTTQVSAHTQKCSETLTEFSHAILKPAKQAYPEAGTPM